MNKYIIKTIRTTKFNNKPYETYEIDGNTVTEDINKATRFTFEEKEEYLRNNILIGTVIVMVAKPRKYRIKVNGHYVKECDLEYLVECEKIDSVFSEDFAQAIKKECPRIELEEIK